ncbi:MAG: 4Fe-4S dicluster domain-containing protein [Dehalococcoidia bacterium]|nr:4Fe-4S dicluster domain-containing protein [Dehalococcoidia bacterium]
MSTDRRDFLKLAGVGSAAALVGLGLAAPRTVDAASASGIKAMLYDSSKCVGCRACQTACRTQNKLPPESNDYGLLYDNPLALSPGTLTLIKARQVTIDGRADLLLCKYQCMHCTDAGCVKTCPTGALTHHELGFVFYDSEKCSGCGYCREACPFDVPRIGGNNVTGAQRMHKCTFCPERVTIGQPTACAEACPTGALIFGDRSDLVAQASERLDTLKADYSNAVFYGNDEVGGLHAMYILKEGPDAYMLPSVPKVSPSVGLRQDILKPFGYAVVCLAALGLGFNYLVARARISREKED